jgi:transcriptional regulator with XRE-family HTH domain
MSSLLNQLDELFYDDASEIEYRHEIAISAFTNDIARLMSAQGITQADLARTLGVSRARVSQIMQHKSSPTLHTMVQVAHAIGCNVSPGVAPCGFRPAGLYVADGGKTTAGYRETNRLNRTVHGSYTAADRIAV